MSNCKLCLADCAFSGKDMKKGTCKGYIPMTNSDRVRAMSDEELAKAINLLAEGESVIPILPAPSGVRRGFGARYGHSTGSL